MFEVKAKVDNVGQKEKTYTYEEICKRPGLYRDTDGKILVVFKRYSVEPVEPFIVFTGGNISSISSPDLWKNQKESYFKDYFGKIEIVLENKVK